MDPHEQLDEDVEDALLHIADDFLEQSVSAAAHLAKHRKANAIDARDVQVVLGEKREGESHFLAPIFRFQK